MYREIVLQKFEHFFVSIVSFQRKYLSGKRLQGNNRSDFIVLLFPLRVKLLAHSVLYCFHKGFFKLRMVLY